MKHLFLEVLFIAGLMGSSAWALFETNSESAKSAPVTMDKAVQAAVTGTELSKGEDRTVYQVKIIDIADKTREVYVDTQTIEVKIEK